jgi:transcriptional regulator with XRE-family HTH domain
MATFGELVAQARKRKLLSQKELAGRIRKENGDAISAQYLNDIERGRRNPPSEYLIRQLADQLELDSEYLCLVAGALPQDVVGPISEAEPGVVRQAFRHFRKRIQREK